MNCGKIRRKINLYIDNRLGPKDKSLFERHLEQCRACSQEYSKAAAIVSATRGIMTEDLPESFSADLRIKLAEAKENNADGILNLFRKPVFRAVAATAAALLIIFIAGGIVNNSLNLLNGNTSMDAAAAFTAQSDEILKESNETFAAAAFGASRDCINTIITVTTEKPEEQLENFKLFAEGYGAEQLDIVQATDSTETNLTAPTSAESRFTVPKDAYSILVKYLEDKYSAGNIYYQEISVPGETESSIIISILFID